MAESTTTHMSVKALPFILFIVSPHGSSPEYSSESLCGSGREAICGESLTANKHVRQGKIAATFRSAARSFEGARVPSGNDVLR
jgi:hypothetical protein